MFYLLRSTFGTALLGSIVAGMVFAENEGQDGIRWQSLLKQQSYRSDQHLYNGKRETFRKLIKQGVTTPGLEANFVPQGIARVPGSDSLVLLSGYVGTRLVRESRFLVLHGPPSWDPKSCHSVVILMDLQKGIPLRVVRLVDNQERPLALHAGGIAVTSRYFWVPSQFRLRRFPLREVLDADSDIIALKAVEEDGIRVDSLGSHLTFHDDCLWVGDFVGGDVKPADVPHHATALGRTKYTAWTAAYRLTAQESIQDTARYDIHFRGKRIEVIRPERVVFHRQRVQGVAFREGGQVVLSVSYGSGNSKIAFYDMGPSPWDPENCDSTVLPDGAEVPARVAGDAPENCRLLLQLAAPPGAEGITFAGDQLRIVFEAGANPYRERWAGSGIEDRILTIGLPSMPADDSR